MIICGSVCCLMQYDCKGKLGLTDTKSVLRCVYYHFECLSEPVRLKTLKILGIRKLPAQSLTPSSTCRGYINVLDRNPREM